MPKLSRFYLFLPLGLLALTGCSNDVTGLGEGRFYNTTQQPIEVKPSAVSLTLKVSPNGQSLSPKSVEKLNAMLLEQGRLNLQTITLMPRTPAAEKMAGRLGRILQKNGLPQSQLRQHAALRGGPATGEKNNEQVQEKLSDDLLIISEAIVANVPDCTLAGAENWLKSPYRAAGALGCANRANLARMVSDPRDLVRPRTLGAGDGIQADGAMQRYHDDEIRELIDINFEED
ncbi:CpaD family pilus assembly lipoprotein [Terasakiella pusilla]|uniref:CpaD family pilus assembly lipoprotein n=1 Tax=Terasakiella pusilla TaxID=64973 RepID=UPI003AA7AE42